MQVTLYCSRSEGSERNTTRGAQTYLT